MALTKGGENENPRNMAVQTRKHNKGHNAKETSET